MLNCLVFSEEKPSVMCLSLYLSVPRVCVYVFVCILMRMRASHRASVEVIDQPQSLAPTFYRVSDRVFLVCAGAWASEDSPVSMPHFAVKRQGCRHTPLCWDLNSHLHSCLGSALSTEPSLQPCIYSLIRSSALGIAS